MHLNHLNGKLQLQIDVFCRDMIEAVNQWRTEVEDTPEIKARMDSLINISLASFWNIHCIWLNINEVNFTVGTKRFTSFNDFPNTN